jgi:PAS domain S-box-containing protein
MTAATALFITVAVPTWGLSGTAPLPEPAVQVVSDGLPRAVPLRLPGRFDAADLPWTSRVAATWTLDPPDDTVPWGVWIERPYYAAELRWDGQVVATSGDPYGIRRSEAALLAWLPPGQGPRTLELVVQGDFGKGGVVGRMVHGPFVQVQRMAARVEADLVGLTLVLAALALINLTLGVRKTPRPANLYFGLLCLLLATYLLLRTDLALGWAGDAEWPIRARRFVTAWLGPVAMGVPLTFLRPVAPVWLRGIIAAAGSFSLGAFLVPMTFMPALEAVLDGALLVSAAGWMVLVGRLAWRGQSGDVLLAATSLAPLGYGVVSEILVTNGIIGGGSHLMPTVITFAVGVTAALMVRDAEQSERHDRLVRSSVDAMVCVTREGRVVDANPAAAVLLGHNPLGANLTAWVVADDKPILEAHLTPGPHRPDRAEIRLRGQERVLESVGTAIDEGVFLLLLRDVTGRRKLDAGLLQAARMETLAVLVGGIAHDFNNMLGTLLAHVGFLQVLVKNDAAVQQRLSRMETTIDRASQLTRRLATLAGGTTAALAPTDLMKTTYAAVELVRPTLPERVHLTVDASSRHHTVAASAADLEQVLVNLLVNAREAVSLSGTILVTIRSFETPEGARGALLAIEDDGPGVPVDQREAIFQPFTTTRAKKANAGLGLAVARQIVKEHHGRIWVEDRPGGGARFCVALHDATALDDEAGPLPGGRQVVLVEDEDVLRDAWSSALIKAGYECTSYPDGVAAARALQARRPDLLVTDVLMPGLNGIELGRVARAMYADLPIVYVSAYIPDGALDGDPLAFKVDKPVRSARLVSMVGHAGRVAERRRRGSDEVTDAIRVFPSLLSVTWESARGRTPSPVARERREGEGG